MTASADGELIGVVRPDRVPVSPARPDQLGVDFSHGFRTHGSIFFNLCIAFAFSARVDQVTVDDRR